MHCHGTSEDKRVLDALCILTMSLKSAHRHGPAEKVSAVGKTVLHGRPIVTKFLQDADCMAALLNGNAQLLVGEYGRSKLMCCSQDSSANI
jgi:hypothetical protein